MKKNQVLRGVILSSIFATGISGIAWAGDSRPPAANVAADSTVSMSRYYSVAPANIGQFPGNLVRLSCDTNGAHPTEQGQHRSDYALVLDDENVLHPLVPGTDEVRRELSSAGLQGADVLAHGKYYPSSGVIFVDRLEIRKSGAADGAESSARQSDRWSAARLSRCTSD